jgi:hypothetical protein
MSLSTIRTGKTAREPCANGAICKPGASIRLAHTELASPIQPGRSPRKLRPGDAWA